MSSKRKAISKSEDFSRWFDSVLSEAELIDVRYGVKGFIVYRPNGMRIVRKIYDILEEELDKTGHKQVLFPLVIPFSNLKRESEHIKGFEDQVFIIERAGGEELQEKLALRPTSETAVYPMVALWVRSYTDLPLKMYQSVAVYRHETKATRPLLRGREFLWIETHDVFATSDEAKRQIEEDLRIEKNVCEKLGLAFIVADREPWDKFPGAEYSYAYDALLPDGHVLQIGTTHYLGKNFTTAFGVRFLSSEGRWEVPYSTCFGPGVGRMLAAIVATHGDDKGLILPFGMAEYDIVIIPIVQKEKINEVLEKCKKVNDELAKAGFNSYLDASDESPGSKFYKWEVKGIPVRIEIGPEEVNSKALTIFRRDKMSRIKVPDSELVGIVSAIREDIVKELHTRSSRILESRQRWARSKDEVISLASNGYIIKMQFCGRQSCADEIKAATKGFEVRGRPIYETASVEGRCAWCGSDSKQVVYVANAY